MKKDLDKELREAIEELERITADPEARELYEQREKQLRDFVSFANSSMRKGLKEGMEKGMEKGIKQGIEQGIEKGIEQNKKEIVLNMHKVKMEIELISKIVELPTEEVEKIIKEN